MIRRYVYALVLAAVVVVSMLCLCGGYAWYEERKAEREARRQRRQENAA